MTTEVETRKQERPAARLIVCVRQAPLGHILCIALISAPLTLVDGKSLNAVAAYPF